MTAFVCFLDRSWFVCLSVSFHICVCVYTVYFLSFVVTLFSTGVIDCLERIVSEITNYLSSGTVLCSLARYTASHFLRNILWLPSLQRKTGIGNFHHRHKQRSTIIFYILMQHNTDAIFSYIHHSLRSTLCRGKTSPMD